MSRSTGEPMWRLSSQKREIAPSQSESLIKGKLNNDSHATSPRLAVLTLPQASPALGAFYRGMRVATAGLLGLCPPRDGR